MQFTQVHRFAFYGVELFLLETVEDGVAKIEAVVSPTMDSVFENNEEFWRILLASKQDTNLKDSARDAPMSASSAVRLLLEGQQQVVVVPLIPFSTVVGGMVVFAMEDPDTPRYIVRKLTGLRALISAFMAVYRNFDPDGLKRLDGQPPLTYGKVEQIRTELFRRSTGEDLVNMTAADKVAAIEPLVRNMQGMISMMEDLYSYWVFQYGNDPTPEQKANLLRRRKELDHRHEQYRQAQEILISAKTLI